MEIGSRDFVFAVWPLNEVRGSFPGILDRFAREGPMSPPVIIGRHRKPEAAIVPYRLFARLLEVYEAQQAPQILAHGLAGRADTADNAFVDVRELL